MQLLVALHARKIHFYRYGEAGLLSLLFLLILHLILMLDRARKQELTHIFIFYNELRSSYQRISELEGFL